MHILVIDDDEDIRAVLEVVLEAQGCRVETAVDGIDALERLRAGSRPSVILLDMMMPRLDGEGLMRAMQDDPRLAGIPVVVMSGHRAARDKAAGLEAAAWLVKPVDLEQLLATVRAAADRGAAVG
jgi:DNA-binding response OmpR family regulator